MVGVVPFTVKWMAAHPLPASKHVSVTSCGVKYAPPEGKADTEGATVSKTYATDFAASTLPTCNSPSLVLAL